MTFEQIRLAIYQGHLDRIGKFDLEDANKAFNWIVGGTAQAERIKPIIPQPGSKPEVEYDPLRRTYIKEGQQAEVFALNHPRLGAALIITSTVLKYDGSTGAFETLNTRYVPAGQKA